MDDLISRKALLAEYDRVHIGPPGGARKLIEDAPAVQEWISVNDRLPKGGAIVLCNTDYFVEVLQWDKRADMWVDQYRSYRKNYVTHWMPLPEPPKGE